MTYIKTTILNLEKEPDAYHEKYDDSDYYSVHISYEINATLGSDEEDIKAKYIQWLEKLNELKFYVFSAKKDSDKYQIDQNQNVDIIYPAKTTQCESNQVENWINKNEGNISAFRGQVQYELEVSENDKPIFTIADLLKSSAQWPAPLPHKTCFKKIVKIKKILNQDDDFILVAFKSDRDISSLILKEQEKDKVGQNSQEDEKKQNQSTEELFYFINESDSSERFYTEKINEVNVSYPETLSKNGFFKLGQTAHQDYLVLKLINECSPQALNTLETLLDINEADLALYESIDKGETLVKNVSFIKAYAEACAISIFDPISISVLMPGLPDINGTLLSSFINILLKSDKSTNLKDRFRDNYPEIFKEVSNLSYYLALKEDSLIKLCLGGDDESLNKKIDSGEFTFSKLKDEFVKLSADMHDETAFESCIYKIFESVIKKVSNNNDNGLSEFKSLLNGPYNAIDAVRFDLAKVFGKVLTKRQENLSIEYSIKNLVKDKLLKSNYFYMRFYERLSEISDEPFKDVILSLPQNSFLKSIAPKDKLKDVIKDDVIKEKLKNKLKLFAEQIKGKVNKTGRFIPNTSPMPLPIRVGINPYDDAMSTFQERWAGIGILVKKGVDQWRHICVGNLENGDTQLQEDSFIPISLAQQNSAYELYLEYHGFTFLNTEHFSAASLIPFYTETQSSTFPVPKLVYGIDYQIAAFAVTMGGVLPQEVRKTDELCLPFNPNDLGIPQENTYAIQYRRTTAIGKVDIAHDSNTIESNRRINKSYTDVDPLSIDEPRFHLSASNQYAEHIDLYRNVDGSGFIDIAKTDVIEINALKIHGASELNLSIELGSDNALTNNKDIKFGKEKLTIGFNKKENVDIYFEGLEINSRYWLRINIKNHPATPTAISFEKPDYSKIINTVVKEKRENLLLIAANEVIAGKEKFVWKSPFKNLFNGKITLSRVTFLDFEHWFSSPSNLLEIINYGELLRKQLKNQKEKLKKLELLDRLPDPAVSGFLLTLSPINSINGSLSIKPKEKYFPCNISEQVQIESFTEGDLYNFLEKLDKDFKLDLKVTCSSDKTKLDLDLDLDENKNEVLIVLGEGLIANFTIQPVVSKAIMTAKFDERMKELVVGVYKFESNDCWVMQGESLTIEAMYFDYTDIHANLSSEIMISKPNKHSRKYQLTLENSMNFRRFKSVEIESQRWRHSGIAQYQWLKPSKLENDFFVPTEEDKVFESELFTDRENDYAGYKTKLGLTKSLLQEFQWEQPSATWFRHRVKFYSRYHGALAKEGKAFTFFEEDKENNNKKKVVWTHRAGLLANPTQKQLPIPQLRALIPLTLHPDNIDLTRGVPSPPILCINEEPPYAFGGLADRVVALIDNGLSYGFDGNYPDSGTLKPDSFRKEIGPDARQSYTPFVNDCKAVLDVEGPFGLHFEDIETTGANWVNSQHIIHPKMLNDGEHIKPETLIGIRLLRILDPDWVVSNNHSENPNQSTFSIDQTVWIEGITETLKICINNQNVCRYQPSKLSVNKRFIDSANNDGELDLIALSGMKLGSLKILHQPTNQKAGRFILFESTVTDVDKGVSGNLRPITYFDWKIPLDSEQAQDIQVSGCTEIREGFASDLTPIQWTRTSLPKNVVFSISENDIAYTPYNFTQLVASTIDGGVVVKYGNSPLWLYPLNQDINTPQKVHSRYFAVFTKHTKQKGAPLEIFKQITLLSGNKIPVNDSVDIKNVRLGLMQMPCKNLVNVKSGCDQRFENAYFDLVAHKHETNACNFLFHFTFKHSQKFDKTPLKITFTSNTNDLAIIELNNDVTKNLFYIDVWLSAADHYYRTVSRDGDLGKLIKIGKTNTIQNYIEVKMSCQNELWANVSMLVGSNAFKKDNPDNFDFDWIFSDNNNNKPPSESTSKDSLNEMLEPTAQIISLSSPINLT